MGRRTGRPERVQPRRIPPTPGRKPIASSERGQDGPPQRRRLMSTPVPRAGRSAAEAAQTQADGGFAAGAPGPGALPPDRPSPGALPSARPAPGALPPDRPGPRPLPPDRPGPGALRSGRPGPGAYRPGRHSRAFPPAELPDPGEFPTAGGIPPGPPTEGTAADGSDGAS